MRNLMLHALKILLFLLLLLFTNYLLISGYAQPYLYEKTDKFPADCTGLLLGTGKYLPGKVVNLYYLYRIRATGELYRAGKVNRILVSGDNVRADHREVDNMCADLLLEGIPANALIRDNAGVRTVRSIAFAAKYFSDSRFIIISQPFHNERALAMCRYYHLDAVAYNAREPVSIRVIKNVLREAGARIKMILDFASGNQASAAN